MKKMILIKIYNSVISVRNIILTHKFAFSAVKLLVFLLTLFLLYTIFYPNILYLAFETPSRFGRVPMKIGYPINAIAYLFIWLWLFQIGLFCIKSYTLYFMHKIFGTWKWKGLLFIWEQTTIMLFLTISIIGYSFLWGWSYGNISSVVANPNHYFHGISLFMNKYETLIFYTSNLSLIFFILFFIHNLSLKWLFKQLDAWKKSNKKHKPISIKENDSEH
ncbi:MAG: hypothetical protein R3255_06525 [Candidatus Lokiarchaeia archaeon]|nr:hypothetical protein [Candidatus Lokiarchaeia archaeon]